MWHPSQRSKSIASKTIPSRKDIFNGLTPAGLNWLNRDSFYKLQNMVGADYKNNVKGIVDPIDDAIDYQLVINGKIFSTADTINKCETVFDTQHP